MGLSLKMLNCFKQVFKKTYLIPTEYIDYFNSDELSDFQIAVNIYYLLYNHLNSNIIIPTSDVNYRTIFVLLNMYADDIIELKFSSFYGLIYKRKFFKPEFKYLER